MTHPRNGDAARPTDQPTTPTTDAPASAWSAPPGTAAPTAQPGPQPYVRTDPPAPGSDPHTAVSPQAAPDVHPGPGAYPGPKKSRALLITSVVLAVVLVLCGGGGLAAFFLLRDTQGGEGAPEPVAAVDAFLRAVYTERDAAKAADLVCREARDSAKIREKVEEVRDYSRTYHEPRFKWDVPRVEDQDAQRAVVSVKLTMITGDDKTSDQQLRFTVVEKTGWWVCDVG